MDSGLGDPSTYEETTDSKTASETESDRTPSAKTLRYQSTDQWEELCFIAADEMANLVPRMAPFTLEMTDTSNYVDKDGLPRCLGCYYRSGVDSTDGVKISVF